MDNIIGNLSNILICICSLVVLFYSSLDLIKGIGSEIILEWLLLAVIKAEKEFGEGMGQIKLRYVYDLFIEKFKFLSIFITFTQFSELVDIALDNMKDLISNNQNAKSYITNK